ncbi:MAG: penicillin-binding protein 2 [Alicyclobacillaceae bacterium]|nr:penicillin-binding protein 2 [Alicyclobacillaceae bacterium]
MKPWKCGRRLAVWLCLWSCLLLLLGGRLFLIQVAEAHRFENHDLVRLSVEQRREQFIVDSGRGDILDRNGSSLTGRTFLGLVVLPPWHPDPQDPKLHQLAAILGKPSAQIITALEGMKEPGLLSLPGSGSTPVPVELTDTQAAAVQSLRLDGILPRRVKIRYDQDSLARHVIGFIGEDPNLVTQAYDGRYPLNEPVGKMGLERVFQEDLRGNGPARTLHFYVDGRGRPMPGLGIRETVEPDTGLQVQTTLDTDLQRAVESAMDRVGLGKGAAVVIDVQTGDVLAMASRPNFDQNRLPADPASYPKNFAVEADFPGSVFKIVDAAAALDQGKLSAADRFDCQGSVQIGDGVLRCWKVHGPETAEEAFAQSCNVAFAQVAMNMGREAIEKYAGAFGLGRKIGQRINERDVFDGEDPGAVFLGPGDAPRLLANTGIGQENVRISPLQAAVMAATIAADGRRPSPRLVTQLLTVQGDPYRTFPPQPPVQAIRPETARELAEWMRQVVASPQGTGHLLAQARWAVAGKTGTAQTGDPRRVHQWFVGFFPYDHPKYAVAVDALDVASDSGLRYPESVVLEIVNALAARPPSR